MKQPVTSKGLQIIAVVTMLGVAAVLLIQRFGPYPRQMENMAAAAQHIPILRPLLQKDVRFTNITLSVYSGGANGSLAIDGELPSERDLQDLKQIVELSKPPVEVVYHVLVIPPELQEEMQKTNTGSTPK